jgi:2-amino-4-hydroxy-6-hydroxymethyldihydropteridine diphosphokinase
MPRWRTEAPATARAFVGLGANLGDPRASLDAAFVALARLPGTALVAASSRYRSAPVDSWGPDYLNAVVLLHTRLQPLELLHALQRLEQQHGRRRGARNAPRTLDLDLLLYGRRRLDTPELTLPHPRMHLRAFVLRPLVEVAPRMSIPGVGAARALLAGVAGQRVDKLTD